MKVKWNYMYSTNQTQPYRKGLLLGFTRVDPEQTQSKPKVNPVSTGKPHSEVDPEEDTTCVFGKYKKWELQAVR